MNIIIIIFLFLLLVLFSINKYENFSNFDPSEWFYRNNICESVFWNSTRRTRNMSYDLRGDPIIISQQKYIWNNTDRPLTIL